jgi:hypothetical protein
MTDRLPPLPTLRALTAELRALHQAWSHPDAGGEYAALTLIHDDVVHIPRRWRVRAVDNPDPQYGREWVPGDGSTWDAVGAARRLLASARDALDTKPGVE